MITVGMHGTREDGCAACAALSRELARMARAEEEADRKAAALTPGQAGYGEVFQEAIRVRQARDAAGAAATRHEDDDKNNGHRHREH